MEALPFHPNVMPWHENFEVPTVDGQPQQPLAQWVATVPQCSSEYGRDGRWTRDCIVGPPRVNSHVDNPDAWAPLQWGTEHEWIELSIERPCLIQQVRIYESYTPGALWRVSLWNGERFVIVHEQVPQCGQYPPQIRIEDVSINPDRQLVTNRIKLDIDQRGGQSWYEIDAVQVVGILDPSAVVAADTLDDDKDNGRLEVPAALQTILGDALTADCTLVVVVSSADRARQERSSPSPKKAVRIPIHRGILAARSPVFRAMVQRNEMPLGGEVQVRDISPELIQLVLEWIYTGHILQLKPLDCVSLLVAADYYQIDSLIEFCLTTFRRILSVENAARLFAYYDTLGTIPAALRHATLAFCGLHFLAVSRTPNFQELSQSQLLAVIDVYNRSRSIES